MNKYYIEDFTAYLRNIGRHLTTGQTLCISKSALLHFGAEEDKTIITIETGQSYLINCPIDDFGAFFEEGTHCFLQPQGENLYEFRWR